MSNAVTKCDLHYANGYHQFSNYTEEWIEDLQHVCEPVDLMSFYQIARNYYNIKHIGDIVDKRKNELARKAHVRMCHGKV